MNGLAKAKHCVLGLVLAALCWALPAHADHAADVRAIEFLGLRVGATIEQVDARFPLETRVIYSEPDLPSLGVYYYRAVHDHQRTDGNGVTVRTHLQADFDREKRLFRWNLVLTGPDRSEFDTLLDKVIAQYGPANVTNGKTSRTVVYAAPWDNGIVGPQVRLRFIIEEIEAPTDTGEITSGRMTVSFIDYRADEDNTRAAYYHAVDEERRRVGGPEHEPELIR